MKRKFCRFSQRNRRKRCSLSSSVTCVVVVLLFLLFSCCQVHAQQRQQKYDARQMRQEERQREQQRQRESFQRQRRRHRHDHHHEEFHLNATEVKTQAKELFSVIFPTQKPKHVLDGAFQAAKSVVIGSILGLVSFIGLPVATAFHSGIAGFIAGGLVGTCVAIVTTASGLANALVQLTRGILNTWSALQAFRQGQVWNSATHVWCEYSMKEEAAELSSPRTSHSGAVKDVSFYELLGVSTNASSKEIKRSYYKKAKDVHPDKNPDDVHAAEKFLQLHTAYQTLIDEDLRATYDTFGASSSSGTAGQKFLDPSVFFAVLFQSQLVEPFIGELAVASFVDLILKLGMASSADTQTTIQMGDLKVLWSDSEYKSRKRQLEIAQNLKDKIDAYVKGRVSATEFKRACFLEAGEIGRTAFGRRFLATIGRAFQINAGQYLGFHWSFLTWPTGFYYSTLRWKNKNMNRLTSVRKTINVVRAAYLGTKTELETQDQTSFQQVLTSKTNMEVLLPSILEMAWAYNEQDIANTIHGACWRLFFDSDVSSSERLRRSEAIQILGNEFVRLGKSMANAKTCEDTPAETSEIMARLEVAWKLAQQKAQGSYTGGHSSEEMIRRAKKSSEH